MPMRDNRSRNPFRNMETAGPDYPIEWEAVMDAARDRAPPRDPLGLTSADREALGLSPVDVRAVDLGREDARGVLGRALR